MASVEDRRRWRAQFLDALYNLTEGNPMRDVEMSVVAGTIHGLDGDELDGVVEYLTSEGLIEFPGMGGRICLTLEGIRRVEDALQEAVDNDRPGTDAVAFYLTSVEVRAVEALAHQVSVALESGDLDEVRGEDRVELEVDLQTIELQLRAPRKSRTVFRAVLASMARILEGAAGGAVFLAVQELAKKL
jgi:hypothetical protein